MGFFVRLMGVLAFTTVIVSVAHLSAPQDSTGIGFQLKTINRDAQDTVSIKFISFDEIKSLPIQSIALPDHKTKEPITWEGVYLKEVFRQFLDIAWEKIDRLVIKAPDGYSSVISGPRMKQAESALCAFAMKDKAWPQKFGYLRIIFPELHEMHWMNNPAEVELILTSQAVVSSTWRLLFFDAPAFRSFQSKANEKFDGWPVTEILTAMGCSNQGFGIFTRDGQWREYLFDEVAQKMRLMPDSSGTWKIRGEGVPIGFRLRKIFFLYSQQLGLFTRSLTAEDQLLWQALFASIQPRDGQPAKEILLELTSGEKIPSPHLEAYRAGSISLSQLINMEKDARRDLLAIEIKW